MNKITNLYEDINKYSESLDNKSNQLKELEFNYQIK